MQRFFITGLPRTGSTWLMNLLNNIRGVRCLGESSWLGTAIYDVPVLYDELLNGVKRWVDWIAPRKGNVLRTDHDICTIKCINVVSSVVREEEAERIVRYVLREYAFHILQEEGYIVGDKTPVLYPWQLQRYQEIFGDVPTVVLMRNVYDWIISWARVYYMRYVQKAASFRAMPFTETDLMQIDRFYKAGLSKQISYLPQETFRKVARIWAQMYRAAKAAADYRNTLYVDYEEMEAAPHTVLRRVLKHIGSDRCDDIEAAIEKCDVEHTGKSSIYDGYLLGDKPGANTKLLSPNCMAIIDEEVQALGVEV